jgi:hypothetical protein
MQLMSHRTADLAMLRLHAAGWSVGEAGFATGAGFVWQVDATNVGHLILAWAETQAVAWRLAAEQAVQAGNASGGGKIR